MHPCLTPWPMSNQSVSPCVVYCGLLMYIRVFDEFIDVIGKTHLMHCLPHNIVILIIVQCKKISAYVTTEK